MFRLPLTLKIDPMVNRCSNRNGHFCGPRGRPSIGFVGETEINFSCRGCWRRNCTNNSRKIYIKSL